MIFAEHAGHRKRAYVFWDLERSQRYDLMRVFEELSTAEAFRDEAANEESERMRRSWEERSKIWQRRGRGYRAERRSEPDRVAGLCLRC